MKNPPLILPRRRVFTISPTLNLYISQPMPFSIISYIPQRSTITVKLISANWFNLNELFPFLHIKVLNLRICHTGVQYLILYSFSFDVRLYLWISRCLDLYPMVVIHHIDISMLIADAKKFAYCSTKMHYYLVTLVV